MRKTLKRNLSYDDRNHLYYASLYYDGEDGRRVCRTRTYPTMEQAEQFIAAQGRPPISLHGLRHSFASVANSQNVPMFSISKALGHSSTSVTSAVYMHLFDDAVGDVVSQVASAITGAEP